VAKHAGLSAALLVALLGGWFWGASGRWHLDRALQAAELRSDLLEARASLLAARVALYEADFRDMSRHLEDARGSASRVGVRLESLGWRDEAQRLDLAGLDARIDTAERLGAWLDRGAQARAPEVATTIEEVVGPLAKR